MYALPTDVLETLSVNEVDPILRTLVETAVAPKALFIAGYVASAEIEAMIALRREKRWLKNLSKKLPEVVIFVNTPRFV